MAENNEPEETIIHTRQELGLAIQTLVEQCFSNIDIFTLNLDTEIFATDEIIETLKQLCISQPRTRIRILIKRPQSLVSNTHRLLYLAQKLTSYFEIRFPSQEHLQVNHAYVICDKRSYVYQELADKPRGILNLNNALTAREYSEQFNLMWDKAQTDVNLRQMTL